MPLTTKDDFTAEKQMDFTNLIEEVFQLPYPWPLAYANVHCKEKNKSEHLQSSASGATGWKRWINPS